MTIEKGVAIVGGGPAGLYLSILLRAANPELDVTVHERNAAHDAYGFGVVFSDETLDNFENADPDSHRALVERFRQASGSTTPDRAVKDQLLDELQEAVGLSGKMVTEADVLRRAEKLRRQQ